MRLNGIVHNAQKTIVLGLAISLWIGMSVWRINRESRELLLGGVGKKAIGSRWDPRGRDELDHIAALRESADFRDRLGRGRGHGFSWPGLKSAQVSFAWLDLLQGLHNTASSEGDFSWVFSKLDTLIENSPKAEILFVQGIAPFILVVGKDFLGANIVLNELAKREPTSWVPWFWYGFHAMHNLKNYRLAADLFSRAAVIPGSPPQTAGLSVRLKYGNPMDLSPDERLSILETQISPELKEKIKKLRPEWFEGE